MMNDSIKGRAMQRVIVVAVLSMLATGIGLLSPDRAGAWPVKYTSCSSCHVASEPTATVNAALNGVAGTSITVAPGATFEVDWIFRNIAGAGAVGVEIAIPTGWTIASGTANAPALAGWNTVWDATDGKGWQTANSYSTATLFPASPLGYTILFAGTGWDSGNRDAAFDNASAGDLDGVANTMGSDARITVPGGAANGNYTIQLTGVGHNVGGTKGYVTQAITVTVSTGASPPTLTSPTATTIDSTTATLGANITANGGAAITARGTVWGTTAAPTGNVLAEGGTATGVYSHARTALNAGTRIFYRGYATNSAGTAYSPDGSFFTEPSASVTFGTFSLVTSNSMRFSWSAIPASSDGVIVLMKAGSAVDSPPVDGTWSGYTANAAFGSGTQVGTGNYVVYRGNTTQVDITGLNPSTTYHLAIYTYKGTVDTVSVDQGVNYRLTSPATAFQATSAGASPPNVPTALAQYRSDATTPIAAGGYTNQATVNIAADISDPDAGGNVRLHVDFNNDGIEDCSSILYSGNTRLNAQASCAVVNGTSYDWRVRTNDGVLNSAWVAFAGLPDFTVDLTAPVDGTLTPTPGNTQIILNWTAATDATSGVASYTLRRVAGTTPPADCATGNLIYSGALLTASDTGLTNGADYAYRVCATDNVGWTSGGATATAQPAAGCAYANPTVTILTAPKLITSDGGFVDYTVQVTNNDTAICGNTIFTLSAGDTNSTNFYASTLTPTVLTVAPGAAGLTTLRVTAKANQPNASTTDTTVSTVADANHSVVTSTAVKSTINVSGGGCVASGSYLNANGDQLITSR